MSLRMFHRSAYLLVGAVLLIAAVLAPARADDPATFSLRPVVAIGEKWTVTAERRIGLDLEITDAENQKTRQSLVTSRNSRYVREALDVVDGTPVRLKLNFLLAKQSSSRSGQVQVQSDTLPLEGKVVQLDRRSGTLQRECQNDAGFSPDKLSDIAFEEGYERLLPTAPVKLGDTWNPDAEAARFLVGDYTVTPKEGSVRCTLASVAPEGGHQLAVVEITLTIAGRSVAPGNTIGYDLEANLEGRLEFLVDSGKPRLLRLGGKLKGKGSEAGTRGEDVAGVEANGTLSLSVLYQTVEDAGAGGGAGTDD